MLGVLISAASFKVLVENPSEIYNFIPIYQILISQAKMKQALGAATMTNSVASLPRADFLCTDRLIENLLPGQISA